MLELDARSQPNEHCDRPPAKYIAEGRTTSCKALALGKKTRINLVEKQDSIDNEQEGDKNN